MTRKLGDTVVELSGTSSKIYLIEQPAGSTATKSGKQRDYSRHWTPVHLDFIVPEIESAVTRARDAGATLERDIRTHKWGRIAVLADPFGNGFCLIEFLGRGYDEGGRTDPLGSRRDALARTSCSETHRFVPSQGAARAWHIRCTRADGRAFASHTAGRSKRTPCRNPRGGAARGRLHGHHGRARDAQSPAPHRRCRSRRDLHRPGESEPRRAGADVPGVAQRAPPDRDVRRPLPMPTRFAPPSMRASALTSSTACARNA